MLAPTVEKPLEESDVLSMTTKMLQKRKNNKTRINTGRLKLNHSQSNSRNKTA